MRSNPRPIAKTLVEETTILELCARCLWQTFCFVERKSDLSALRWIVEFSPPRRRDRPSASGRRRLNW
jgi:hypothetical protein